MPEVRVSRDGTATHEGKTYTFPASLAGATVTINEGTPTGPPEPPPPPEDKRPSRTAPKSDWVDYAVTEHGADRDTAEALTRRDLIEAYTGGEA